jgi:glucose/arabinose dehydrogenase
MAAPAWADEPDGLQLPPGFHATVVADGLTGLRHIAVRDNGDIYISTLAGRGQARQGIIALHPGADGKADSTEHFGTVDGGTGIRFYRGALYATSTTGVYRFSFKGDSLTPDGDPQTIIDGLPADGHNNRIIAFDGKGGLYVALGGMGNICTMALPAPPAPAAAPRPPPIGRSA